MTVCSDLNTLNEHLESSRAAGLTIGFVPTMGALHEGHLALVQKAAEENQTVVVSIFVNPSQFNNPNDLAVYPRTLESDIELLRRIESVVVFTPEIQHVYPETDDFQPIDLNGLDKVMEGTHRPGHFAGVVHVVYNLFQLIHPDRTYFGKKDYQQLAIIRYMVKKLDLPIEVVSCDTIRSDEGLALSSRNMRLTAEQRKDALHIYQTLQLVKELSFHYNPEEVKVRAINFFKESNLELEYLELANAKTLQPLSGEWPQLSVCCIAALCGDVRLIDNLELSR
jgi:pantoate--beta-alanine ligase